MSGEHRWCFSLCKNAFVDSSELGLHMLTAVYSFGLCALHFDIYYLRYTTLILDTLFCPRVKYVSSGANRIAQWFGTLVALDKDLGSIPSTYVLAHNHL